MTPSTPTGTRTRARCPPTGPRTHPPATQTARARTTTARTATSRTRTARTATARTTTVRTARVRTAGTVVAAGGARSLARRDPGTAAAAPAVTPARARRAPARP